MKLPFTNEYNRLFLFLIGCSSLLYSCQMEKDANLQNELTDPEIREPLASWIDGESKLKILDYLDAVTDSSKTSYIPVEERIATFDNDGTLWSEQPLYFQLFFAIDRIRAMAEDHPEWKENPAIRKIMSGEADELKTLTVKEIVEVVMISHAGMTTDEFDLLVKEWNSSALHPTRKIGFDQLVYQPMIELIELLKENDFKVYIVSGGGVDFMRAFLSEVYDIPPEQIIGSRIKTSYQYQDGIPTINRLAEMDYIDDKEGKPLNIQKIIGRKPLVAGGNSDGDLQMLQWSASSKHQSLQLFVHHTDSIREWAYDRESHIGKFDKGWDQALKDQWLIIDMARDWKIIYPFETEN